MKLQMKLSIFVALTTLAAISGTKVLLEKPDFLHPCRTTDPNFNSCYAKNVQVIFREWKSGVPGLKTVGPLDPLAIKRVVISTDPNSPIAISLDLHSVMIHGLGGTIANDASFDSDKLLIKYKLFVPKAQLVADYSVNGHLLNLALDGKGKADITLDNIKINVAMRVKIREEGGFIFTDVDKLRLEIEDLDGMHMQLDNLFNGNKALEDSANEVFNDNWRSIYEVISPGLTSAVETVLNDRIKKVYSYVPASYYIEDLPHAA